MSPFRVHLASILGTILMFIAALWLNEMLFARTEFVQGINWIYLPAGVRLLSTLLLAEGGAIGLLLAGWIVKFTYVFPHDPQRAFIGGIISSLVPYLIYKAAQHRYGLEASLSNLTSSRLFVLILAFSFLDPLAQHVWLLLQGRTHLLFEGLTVMVIGNLVGTMLVIYTLKVGLALSARLLPHAPARAKAHQRIPP